MIINTDLVIIPGKQEKFDIFGNKKVKVCEDYGMKTFKKQKENIVVISDGCSMQNFSDWGARILTYNYFKDIFFDINIFNELTGMDKTVKEKFDKSVFEKSRLQLREMGIPLYQKIDFDSFYNKENFSIWDILNRNILSATISSLHITHGGHVISNVINDGYLIIGQKDGCICVERLNYVLNAPYYLIHRYEEMNKKLYEEQFKDNKIIWKRFVDEGGGFTGIGEIFCEKDFNFFMKYDIHDLKFILITTDGLDTFLPLTDMDIIKKLVDFKSLRGEFIQRKMNSIYKELHKENIHNLDDLTVAGFSLEEE